MDKRKELIFEVYGEITRRYFDWKNIVKTLKGYAAKFNKCYVCELSINELEEVMEDLTRGENK